MNGTRRLIEEITEISTPRDTCALRFATVTNIVAGPPSRVTCTVGTGGGSRTYVASTVASVVVGDRVALLQSSQGTALVLGKLV